MTEKIPNYLVKSYTKNKSPQDRKEFLATYNYIKYLTSNFYIQLSQNEILSFIENDKWIDKSSINEYIINAFSSKPKFDVDVNSDNIERVFKENKNGVKIANLKSDIELKKRQIADKISQIDSLNQSIVILRKNIEIAESETGDFLSKIIINIVKSSRFDHIYYCTLNRRLFFVQKNNCILEEDGVKYDFGKYAIAWSPMTSIFEIYPYEDNMTSSQYIHPHVFENFTVCWGNAAASISELTSNQSFDKIILIIDQILNNWNPGSPVRHITFYHWNKIKNYKELKNNYYTVSEENGRLHPRYWNGTSDMHNFIYPIYNFNLESIMQQSETNVETLDQELDTELLSNTGT